MRHLLLHVCCAPCSAYSVPALREEFPAITGFFHNPNIHPADEHARRREALERFAPQIGLPVVWSGDEGPASWREAVAGREPQRCRHCFGLRLRAAAREARRRGCDAFSTTILFSRYTAHDLVRAAGEAAAREEGVPFHYRDLRVGWDEGWRRYGPTGLHRQWYCGCELSRQERQARRDALAAGRGAA